ncbi:type I-E CRISPR-associated protein Cse2/CasB [Streptomyces sp. NPDC004111]|uniref:type I-E CRISPR-associated protein Cse2/CasB n=1 Tax=Streptomyces sp. NPDC004111 TaxID=3364690 RepID=UPI00368E2531
MTPTPTPTATAAVAKPSARQDQFDRHDKFTGYLIELCRDSKKAQSDLRSGLGRPVERCHYLHRYLVPRLPERQHPDARRAHYAIAALIAARPRKARDADTAAAEQPATSTGSTEPPAWWVRPNLGASLALAVNDGYLKPDSAEDDLHLMTRQSSDAIHPRLPALTRHLLTCGVAVDWSVLLEDLTWWNRDRDRIATRWLESYFRVRTYENNDDSTKESR